MQVDQKVYKTSFLYKLGYFAIFFFLMLVFAIFFAPKLGLAGVLGLTIGVNLMMFQKITITEDSVDAKLIIGKARVHGFDEGKFSLETLTGIKAIAMAFRLKKQVLKYQANGANKSIAVVFMMPDKMLCEIYQNIPESAKQNTTQVEEVS